MSPLEVQDGQAYPSSGSSAGIAMLYTWQQSKTVQTFRLPNRLAQTYGFQLLIAMAQGVTPATTQDPK